MKKSLLALAALTAFAGAASAQSSVTLFGIVDLAARSVDNGSAGSIKSLSSAGNATSRLGFRGVEDLGGGLRAGFWIEGQLDPDTGNAGGQTWQRRSTVSLIGSFGEVRLGRDYTPSFWNRTVFDPFGTNGVASYDNLTSTLSSGAGTSVRANNTIGYFLPAMGGLYGQIQVAAGEGNDTNKYQGGRIGYAAGPINVALAYGKTDLGATDFKEMNIGASYKFAIATVMAQYREADFGAREQKNTLLGVAVPFGAGTFKASYVKTTGSAGVEADQIGVGYVYDLSKRTALYTHFARVSNEGTAATGARFTASGSGPAFTAGGQDSTGYEFGIRHSF